MAAFVFNFVLAFSVCEVGFISNLYLFPILGNGSTLSITVVIRFGLLIPALLRALFFQNVVFEKEWIEEDSKSEDSKKKQN